MRQVGFFFYFNFFYYLTKTKICCSSKNENSVNTYAAAYGQKVGWRFVAHKTGASLQQLK